jgi:hypothetical protein
VLAVGDTTCEAAVPRRVVSEEQLALTPEYHWYVYGVVPPDGLAIRVILWPVFIFGEEGVIAPATNAEFTVTVLPDEQRETGRKAESVTL